MANHHLEPILPLVIYYSFAILSCLVNGGTSILGWQMQIGELYSSQLILPLTPTFFGLIYIVKLLNGPSRAAHKTTNKESHRETKILALGPMQLQVPVPVYNTIWPQLGGSFKIAQNTTTSNALIDTGSG
jgi:hypothetical protein